jgi:hypothetical protein
MARASCFTPTALGAKIVSNTGDGFEREKLPDQEDCCLHIYIYIHMHINE